MNTKRIPAQIWIFMLALALIVAPSCKSAKRGAVIGGATGAAAGGAVGAVIGSKKGNTAVGAILGAAIGGTAGAIIGDLMDKQAKDLEEDLGESAEVDRVGEGIAITFDSGLLFDFNSAALRQATRDNLRKMAETLKEYPDTNLLVEGHTDSKGADDYNMNLSRQRAQSVADFLNSLGVDRNRFTIKAYGEAQPVATNDTEEGRQQNRRVQMAIFANEEMKQDAKTGKLGNN